MKIIAVTQGSTEWLELRAKYNTASEAPAAMGASKHTSRDNLLRQKATGIIPEVTAVQQKIYDKGHRAEAAARDILEDETGEDFYPDTCISDDYFFLASLDGRTSNGKILFEHKLWNKDLASDVYAGNLHPHYFWQLEQQLLVTGADKVIFVCSDGTKDNWAQMDYYAVPGRAERLIAGWSQFDIDKAAYVPVEATAALAPTGRAPESLPALFITVKGEVTDSNLANFKEVALAAIRSVNRELQTDQDFADADKAVKWCSDIEERVAGAKQNALSQTASIDALFKTMDDISAEARQVRLDLSKLVAARKVSLKTELLTNTKTQWGDYLRVCNKRIGKDYMPEIPVDFAGAIYGKKTFDSTRAALNTALATAKIEASGIVELIQDNIAKLDARGSAHKFLFSADIANLVLKEPADLDATITARISEFNKAEDDRLEKQREAIRAEEVARLAKEAAETAARAQLEADEIARLDKLNKTMVVDVPAAPQKAPQIIQKLMQLAPVLSDKADANRFAIDCLDSIEPPAEPEWQLDHLPEVPMQCIEVREVNVYRFLPYKPNSTEFKRGKKGRWQRHNGYGFENAEPQNGPWRVTAGADDADQQAA